MFEPRLDPPWKIIFRRKSLYSVDLDTAKTVDELHKRVYLACGHSSQKHLQSLETVTFLQFLVLCIIVYYLTANGILIASREQDFYTKTKSECQNDVRVRQLFHLS